MAKNNKVVYEHFKSINHLMNEMDQRPINKAFEYRVKRDMTMASQAIEENKHFSKTYDYKEALDIMGAGYQDPLEKMQKAILKIGRSDNYSRPRTRNAVAGYAPDVPAALMGLPLNMFNKERQAIKSKNIHFVYSFCVAADIKPEQLIKAGINFISLVNSVEKQGYRAKIDVIFVSIAQTAGTCAAYSVNVKEYGQSLNLLKLTFPLVHPAMLRRLSFKWLETTPELKETEYAARAYGIPLTLKLNMDGKKEFEYLKAAGIISGENVYFCNAYQAMKADDIQELAQKIGMDGR